ncbi:MAG: cytochrome c [Proteobacteria bacterium]|nr:cytochrome c [Pseudomonadota bacterium]
MRSVEVTQALAAQGKTLFNACTACHGGNGEGKTGIGPRLNSDSFLAAASDEMLVRTISEGRSGTTMIPWKTGLKPEQINAIVAYIRSWKDVPPAKLDQAPLHGDTEAGKRLFQSICSACHGRTGAGYQETANGTGIGRRAFLTQVSDGYLRYIIRHGKSATKMRGFAENSKVAVANLTDAQIENIISYLRHYAW